MRMGETLEEVLRHYGKDTELLKHRDKIGINAWKREEALQKLAVLPEMIPFLDPQKAIRAEFYYDPDYPKAIILLEGLKDLR